MIFGRKPKHKALMVTEDHQLREVDLDVDAASMSDHRASRSWGLVPSAVIPQHGTRKAYQVICARCNGPFNSRKGRWEPFDQAEVSRIADQCVDKQIAELPRLALQEWSRSLMRLAIVGLVLAVGVMAFVVALSSGAVRIPGL